MDQQEPLAQVSVFLSIQGRANHIPMHRIVDYIYLIIPPQVNMMIDQQMTL